MTRGGNLTGFVRTGLVLAIGIVLAGGLLLGAPTVRAEDEEERVLTFEGPTPLIDVIRAIGESLDLPLVWDPKSRAFQNKEVMGDVVLRGTTEEILAGFRGLLTFYELVVIPVGKGANQKLMIMDARQTAAIVKLKPKYVELNDDNIEQYAGMDGVFLTTTIRVANMENLRDARNALNRIVTGQNIGNVTEVPDARAFVVTDFAPNVVAIYRLLKEMDVGTPPDAAEAAAREVVFEAVRLKHAKAAEAVSVLTQHFAAPAAPPARQRTPQQAPSLVPALPGLKIHADPRLNQVLVTGMRKDVNRVLEVIGAMDQPLTPPTAQIQVVRLQHIDATAAAHVLDQLIRRYPQPWQRGPGTEYLPAVVADSQTNAVLLHGDDAAITMLRRVLADLDQVQEKDGDE
jgi:type II secretory pathway component GspD/PulD (secretin)